jgi:DNA-binding transcriptional MerR regulator
VSVSETMVGSAGLTVSTLARRVGVGADTVCYYGRARCWHRRSGRRRTPHYDESAVDRLQFIRGAQRLGLRLRRSRRRWRTMPGGARPIRPEQMLRNHIAEIDRELPAAVAAR